MSELGPGPLLSTEETDALLSAMRAPTEGGGGEPIDLAAPDRSLHAVLPQVDRMGPALRTGVTTCIRRLLSCSVKVADDPTEVVNSSVAISSLEVGTAVAMLRTPSNQIGLLTIAPPLAALLLERRLGAPAEVESPPPVSTGRFSKVDARVLLPVSSALLDVFAKLFCDLGKQLRVERIIESRDDMPRLPSSEPLLSVSLRIWAGSIEDAEVRFMLTPAAVRDSLGIEESVVPKARATATDRSRLEAQLCQTTIRAIAVLGRANGTVRELLALDVGSVIRLDSVPGQTVPVNVGDTTVFEGHPVVHHGNLAVAITARSPGSTEAA